MPHTLILTRHAKSDWSHEDLDDHERPLNERGLTAAPLVGRKLMDRGLVPNQVLCSTARRTQQTWAGMASRMEAAPEPELISALYHAAPDTMLRILQGASGEIVAMIGHNPGIGALAHMLLAAGPAHPKFRIYPTGATLIAEVDDWKQLENGKGRLIDFFVPRDLPGHP